MVCSVHTYGRIPAGYMPITWHAFIVSDFARPSVDSLEMLDVFWLTVAAVLTEKSPQLLPDYG